MIAMGALSRTSILVPKMGGAGKLSVSPAKGGGGGGVSRLGARLTEMVGDVPMEMVGQGSVIATWNLRVRGEGTEITKVALDKDGPRGQPKERTARAE